MKTDASTRGTTSKTRSMVKVSTSGQMASSTKVAGSMESSTAWAFTCPLAKSRGMASGTKERNWPGLTRNK